MHTNSTFRMVRKETVCMYLCYKECVKVILLLFFLSLSQFSYILIFHSESHPLCRLEEWAIVYKVWMVSQRTRKTNGQTKCYFFSLFRSIKILNFHLTSLQTLCREINDHVHLDTHICMYVYLPSKRRHTTINTSVLCKLQWIIIHSNSVILIILIIVLSNGLSRLIASEMNIFIYIIYVCILCIFMYININIHSIHRYYVNKNFVWMRLIVWQH